MGRKGNYIEKPKRGPGRKARKQADPVFKFSKDDGTDGKKLSSNQKKRLKKRELQKNQPVQEEPKVTQQKKVTKPRANQQIDSTTGVPPEVFDVEKSRQKYKQLGKKAQPPSTTTVGVSNGVAKRGAGAGDPKKVRQLFDSDDEMENEDPKPKTGGRPSKSQMKKFLQQADSDEDESDDEEELDSDEDDDEEAAEQDSEDSAEEGDSDEDDDDDEEEDGDEDMLPIEAANKKLKKQMAQEQKLADEEMKESAANRERFEFPTEEQLAQTTNLQDVNMRIKDVIGVLSDFAANRDPERARCEYIDLLRKDLCLYYSYNEYFMNLLMDLFSPNELLEFLEASELQRPITIRTNSLKTRRRDLAQALINRGINLDPIGKWSKDGLVVYTSQVPLGATPEYFAGHYMLQGGSSMLPVLALAPEENERILDMCAAPGGKSSHIAALMKNTGVLVVNDSNRERLHAVLGNFHRLGVQNAIVTCMDGIKFRDAMKGFDRVLLDAPCTGSGVIAKDPSVKTSKTEIDVQKCYNLQRRLLLSAIDCLSAKSKTGGYLVYSTCSVLPQENEWVIDFALKKRNVRLVPLGIDFGVEGLTRFGVQRYHSSMKLTRRFYPHTHNMDGFFVAKLQKFSDAIPKSTEDAADTEPAEGVEGVEGAEEIKLPKKIDRRDWYYKDILEKRKAEREDKNHVVKVFQKPTNVNKKKKSWKKNSDSAATSNTESTAAEAKPQQNGFAKATKMFATNGKPAVTSAEREMAEASKLKKVMQKLKQSSVAAAAAGGGKGNPGKASKGHTNKSGGKSEKAKHSNGKVPGVKKNAFKKKVGKVGKH
uniref:Putative trna and rrna cytosine-c5-methylase nucleolar protein nol1/nop2 n=2 Tax=Anopheles triannulatus TaxID=58253 RepID=A0A2M4AAZ8_9DIPT